MQQFLDFFKKLNAWQKVATLVSILAGGIAIVLLSSSCSSIRAGYTRGRYIEQHDSTYIIYSQTLTKSKSYSYGK